MATQDFYVSFGSNAAAWTGQLKKELAPARAEIRLFQEELNRLGQGPAGSALGRVIQALGSRGGGGSAPATSTARSTAADTGQFTQMAREAAIYNAELSGMISKLATVVQAVSTVGGRVSDAQRYANRSAGSRSGLASKSRAGDSGRFTTSDDPDAINAAAGSRRRAVNTRGALPGGGSAVTIANTPKVLVDDASFRRVVDAVEKNVKATRRVEDAIDRLGSTLGARNSDGGSRGAYEPRQRGGGKGRRDGAAGDTATDEAPYVPAEVRAAGRRASRLTQSRGAVQDVQAIRAQRDADVAERQAALQQITTARDALRAKGGAGAAQQVQAAEAGMARLVTEIEELQKPLQRERSQTNRQNAAQARAQAGPQLAGVDRARIARDIQLAADPGELSRMARNQSLGGTSKDRLREIAGSFTQAGYATPFTSKTRNPQLLELIAQSRRAFDQAGDDVARFGADKVRTVPAQISRSMRGVINGMVGSMRMTTEEAAADQTLTRDRSSGTSYMRQTLNVPAPPEIAAAQQTAEARNTRLLATAHSEAGRLLQRNPSFNPYDPKLRAGITGNDQTARTAREALARLTRAVEALDRRWEGGANVPPAIRAGIASRSQARVAFDDSRSAAAEQVRTRVESAGDIRRSAIDAMFGGATGLAGGQSSNQDMTRLFPGVRFNRKLDLRPTDATETAGVDIAGVRKAFNKYVKAFRGLAELNQSGDATPEQLEQSTIAMRRSMTRFIEQYERAFQATLRTADQTVTTPNGAETFRSYGLAQQQQAVAEDRAANTAARRAADRALRTGQGDQGVLDRASALTQTRISRLTALHGTVGDYNLSDLGQREKLIARSKTAGVPLGLAQTANRGDVERAIEDAILAARSRLSNLQGNIASRAESASGERVGGRNGRSGGGKRNGDDGSNGGGRGGDATGGARGGGNRDVLQRILAELTSMHGTVRQGTKLGVRRPKTQQRPAGTSEEPTARANSALRQQARRQQQPLTGVTPQTRQDFLASLRDIDPELFGRLQGRSAVHQATELVRGGQSGRLTRTEALGLYGSELGATRGAAQRNLNQSLGQAALGDRTAALRAGQHEHAAEVAAQSARAQRENAEAIAATQRVESSYAATLRLVSDATRREVTTLEQLVAARRAGNTSAEQEQRIIAAQVRVYAALNRELKGQAGFGTSAPRRQAIANVFQHAGADTSSSQLDDIRRHANIANAADTSAGGGNDAASAARRQGENIGAAMGNGARDRFASLFGDRGFFGRVVNSVGTFLVRNASATLVFGLTNAIQDAVSQAIQTESTFVRVSEALNATGRSSDGLRTKLQGLSQQYGVALKDVYTTAASLAGLFNSSDVGNDQLVGLTQVATQLEIISGGALSATEAVKGLASVTSAYGEEGSKHIADVVTVIQNQLSVNVEDTIEGVSRLAGETKEMGISFANAATQVAAISKLTGQSGMAAGEQYSRMLESLQTGKTQSAIQRALGSIEANNGGPIDVSGAFAQRDYTTVINQLLTGYSKLNQVQKEHVAISLGGARQAAATNAFLSQGSEILAVQTDAQNANGAAAERAGKISEQLNIQMAKLRQGFVNFFAALERSGALTAVGVALKGLITVIDVVNHGISTFNDLVDATPGGDKIEQLVFLVGGLAASFVAARAAARGLLLAMQIPGRLLTGVGGAAGARAVGGAAAAESTAAAAGAGAAGNAGLLAMLRGARRPRPEPAPVTASSVNRFIPRTAPSVIAEDTRRLEAARETALRGGAYLPPVLSSGLTPAQQAAQTFRATERFSPVDAAGNPTRLGENGTPLGRRRRFFAGGAAAAGTVQQRLSARAESFATSAQAAREAGFSGTQARGYQALSGATSAAASGVGRLESGLTRMAKSALVANLAMVGIAAGVGLLISGYESFKKTHDEFQSALHASFGSATAATTTNEDPQGDAALARNAFQRVSDHNADQNRGFSGFTRALFHGAKDIVTLKNPMDQAREDSGVVGNDWNSKFAQVAHSTNARLGAFAKLSKSVKVNAAAIDNAISTNQDEIGNLVNDIRSSNLSDAQQSALLSSVEDLQSHLQVSSAKWKLAADGLRSVDMLTQDQLAGIGGLLQNMGGLGVSVQKQFSDLTRLQVEQLGFAANSSIGTALNQLAAGGEYTYRYRGVRDNETGQLVSPNAVNLSNYGQGHAADRTHKYVDTTTGAGTTNQQPYQPAYSKGTFKPYTQEERQRKAEDVIRTALRSARATIETLPEGSDQRAKEIELAGQLENQLSQSIATRLQNAIDKAQAQVSHSTFGGDYAGAQAAVASVVKAIEAQGTEANTPRAVIQAQIDQVQDQAAQTAATGAAMQYEQAKLHTRNQQALAQDELSAANASLAIIQQRFRAGTASAQTLLGAQQRQKAASDAAQDAENSFQLSTLQTNLDRTTAPANALAQARNQVTIAATQMQQAAATYTRNSSQYQDALRAYIDAQRNVASAVDDRAQASFSLAIAYDNAAGYTVKAARDGYRQAVDAYRRALRKAGGDKNDPSVKAALATEVTARASARDARLNDELDTINFNKEMGRITSATAIQELQHILDTEKLTKAERRSIMLQIHGLQQDLVNQLTGSGFNIGNIQMPTAYQVRRSLGVDAARTLVKQSVNDLTNAAKPNAAVPGVATTRENALVNVMTQVRDAVHAKGAQHVSVKQDNNFHVPTAHVANQIASQVIAIINQQTGQHVRANTSTPRIVSTR